MKKLYLLPLLILLVIGFVLVGCGPSTPTATQPTATQPTATHHGTYSYSTYVYYTGRYSAHHYRTFGH